MATTQHTVRWLAEANAAEDELNGYLTLLTIGQTLIRVVYIQVLP